MNDCRLIYGASRSHAIIYCQIKALLKFFTGCGSNNCCEESQALHNSGGKKTEINIISICVCVCFQDSLKRK